MMKKRVIVVAAHQDDEIIGCGGTMARHVAEGDEVHVVLMADGVTSRGDTASSSQIDARNHSAEQASQVVGAESLHILGLPDNRMDTLDLLDITQALEAVLDKLQPQVVYTHHAHDLNVDHRLTHQAVMTACRPQPGSSAQEIYSFEVLSSTGWASPSAETAFVPNFFVDVSQQWQQKLTALQCYEQEMRAYPHARSTKGVEALAQYRGSSVGVKVAEAFRLERMVRNYAD